MTNATTLTATGYATQGDRYLRTTQHVAFDQVVRAVETEVYSTVEGEVTMIMVRVTCGNELAVICTTSTTTPAGVRYAPPVAQYTPGEGSTMTELGNLMAVAKVSNVLVSYMAARPLAA